MSSSSQDLVLSDENVDRFLDRNDLHIFINDKLFFGESTHPSSQISAYQTLSGFRTGPNVTWGNLCACMSTVLVLFGGYNYLFRPKQPSLEESIPWDLQSRQMFGNCKAYDFIGMCIPRQ
jgi:hypothetical protein